MTRVLDASALFEYLDGGSGCETVKRAVETAAEQGKNLLMSIVNWGEVYYVLIRRLGLEKADQVVRLIETLPIDLVPADQAITRQASLYKALQKLPYADSFAAALTKIHNAELLTSDKEFRILEKEIRVLWV
jgi:predicted nucleic acid-binding protein